MAHNVLTYAFGKRYPTIVRYVLEKRGWQPALPGERPHLTWRNSRHPVEEVTEAKSFQRFNHFTNSGLITRKAGMTHYLAGMRRTFGSIFDFTPPSFILNKGNLAACIPSITPSTAKRPWIIKPSSGSQGRGIQIVNDLNEVQLPDDAFYAAQLYIQNPLLIQGYKFDMRIYVLVTSFHPLEIHLYREGLVRFATRKYDTNLHSEYTPDSMDRYKHLTNTSINKYSPLFTSEKKLGRLDPEQQEAVREYKESSTFATDIGSTVGGGGHSKRTLRQLICYLHRQHIDWRPIWAEIERIIILTLLPLADHVPKTESRCFELYGFDIILDDDMIPWLIEVNFSPSLSIENATDQTIKETLIEDVVDTLDFSTSSTEPLPNSISETEPIQSRLAPFQDTQYMKDYDRFLCRTPYTHRADALKAGGVGNFDIIFPFDDETKDAANCYAVMDNPQLQKERIVKAVTRKYGQGCKPTSHGQL